MSMTKFVILLLGVLCTYALSAQGAWRTLYGTWTDTGTQWQGNTGGAYHFGPTRLWTSPINSANYVITSQVYKGQHACGHVFKYKTGATVTSSRVTKSWGYFLYPNLMYITGAGLESSPKIKYVMASNTWYNLKTVVSSRIVKIYINNKLVYTVTMQGTGGDSSKGNYVGIWCHNSNTEKGRNFAVRDVSSCSSMTVNSQVMTSPRKCMTSRIAVGRSCSFNCPTGYRRNGPSSIVCGNDGRWAQSPANVTCSVSSCSSMTVNSQVMTSPRECVTSRMAVGRSCSFNCTTGYHRNGPSSIVCGNDGRWAQSPANVTCSDIDECLANSGGCSHRCTNTAGSHVCSCPDPELTLASDKRNCVAQGVSVTCRNTNMAITIPKSLLRGLDRAHVRLMNTSCTATETGTHFTLTTPLTGCGTTSRHTKSAVVYTNKVLEIPVGSGDIITRVREIEIPFSCYYSKSGVVSAVGLHPSNRKLVFSENAEGNFTISLDMFPDNRFVAPYQPSDFPVAVLLRKKLFFEVNARTGDSRLAVLAEDCYATPTSNPRGQAKYTFIRNGCPIDRTVRFHMQPAINAQRFSLEAFKFISKHPFAFVHCHIRICNGSDTSSRCAKGCESRGRGRRDTHAQRLYPLIQGPFSVLRDDEVERDESAKGMSGKDVSFAVMSALFVATIACVVGVALVTVAKRRTNASVAYTAIPLEDAS